MLEVRGQLAKPRERHALTGQQPLDAIGVATAIAPGEQQFAMHLALILGRRRRDPHHTPHLLLAAGRAEEHRHELAGVETIGLRPPAAAIDFDARRVHDAVGDAATRERAVQPEPVPAGLVAALDRGTSRDPEVCLRTGDLRVAHREFARRDGTHEGRLVEPRGHRQRPLGVAELEGDI